MKDLQQHPTTSSGLKGNRGRYNLESPPPAAHISYKPEMVGWQFGWVKIISPEKRWNAAMNHCYVLTKCTGCGAIQWQYLDNLRCGNPKNREYPNYGVRGINQANRRNTILSQFRQEYWPYSQNVVKRKLSQGMTRSEIIQDAERIVIERRKNWHIISARLDFMTLEMPGSIIVLPYRGN